MTNEASVSCLKSSSESEASRMDKDGKCCQSKRVSNSLYIVVEKPSE